jgi:hypothetical protein
VRLDPYGAAITRKVPLRRREFKVFDPARVSSGRERCLGKGIHRRKNLHKKAEKILDLFRVLSY